MCNLIVGINVSQLYSYSMCQPMPSGLYKRWEYDSETKRFTARQNKSRSFENMVLSYFQQSRPDCKIASNATTGWQKKIDCLSVDGICYHCNTVFEAMGCYYHYCPCQEARPSLTDTDIERGVKKRQQDEKRRDYIQQMVTKLLKFGSVSGGVSIKLMHQSKATSEKTFPTDMHWVKKDFCTELLMGDSLVMFNVILKCLNTCATTFPTFLPYSKTTAASRDDIGNLMKQYAGKENIMVQPKRMLISSFILTNGTLITPLLLFYLQLGLVCKKIHRFDQYTPRKCLGNFVQSAVDARRQGDENPNSSVVAETMKLLANSSYDYQIMDRSRHTVTKYLSDVKTHSAINSKMFKRPNHITDQLYEVELVKSEIQHREPIIVGFFILQYAKLRMLELYYNFFKKFCDTDKYEELEMDTDSFYLVLSEGNLEDAILPENEPNGTSYVLKIALITLLRMLSINFSPELAVMPTSNMIKESRVSSKKSLDVQNCCVSVKKHIVVMISVLTSISLAAKDSIKDHWKSVAMVVQWQSSAKS